MTPLHHYSRAARRAIPLLLLLPLTAPRRPSAERHYLYVASPGTRNYVEYGGVGLLVFDIDDGYKFVRRIPTLTAPDGKPSENVKGIVASAATWEGPRSVPASWRSLRAVRVIAHRRRGASSSCISGLKGVAGVL